MEDIKKFLSKYAGATIGIIVAIILLCTRLYILVIGIILVFVCAYIGNYVQINKDDVKDKLKKFIDKL